MPLKRCGTLRQAGHPPIPTLAVASGHRVPLNGEFRLRVEVASVGAPVIWTWTATWSDEVLIFRNMRPSMQHEAQDICHCQGCRCEERAAECCSVHCVLKVQAASFGDRSSRERHLAGFWLRSSVAAKRSCELRNARRT